MSNPALYPQIKLASGWNYYFYAADNEARACIDALAEVMHLEKGPGKGQKVFVYCSDREDTYTRITVPEAVDQPVLCRIDPYKSRDEFYLMVERIAQAVAAAAIDRGGALIHGGFCSLRGQGAIMAGRGGIGKSTASSRLPHPWISHCDDSTLVVPGLNGKYFAHPWPTWSRYYFGGAGGSWDVKLYYPLTVLFFLSQAEEDQLEALNSSQAKPMLIDTIEHVTRTNRKKDQARRDFLLQCVCSAETIAGNVPAYRLRISLGGHFWIKMEEVMAEGIAETCGKGNSSAGEETALQPVPELSASATSEETLRTLHFIYRGTSMNPTFFEPEMLTVLPYGKGEKPVKGDVVCYHTEVKTEHIVHRVIAVKDGQIKTRGDNSREPDQYTLKGTDITGRIVGASRNGKSRVIHGGAAGVIEMHLNRLSRRINRLMTGLLRAAYYGLAGSGLLRRLKPAGLHFRVVIFTRLNIKIPKLILNGRTVGSYNFQKGSWTIKRPYRLFVDDKSLPHFDSALMNPDEKPHINGDY